MKKYGILAIAVLIWGCQHAPYSDQGQDVPTAGKIDMGVDYGDSFAITEQLHMFQINYPNAVITPKYMCEVNLMRQLEKGDLRFVVMNRDFTPAEKENLERRDITIRSALVARTSIALVVNKSNPIVKLTQKQLKEILKGDSRNWSQLGGNATAMQVVFDQGCGSNYTYFEKLWFGKAAMGKNIAEKKTPHAVLDFVGRNEGALGFVGVNWISDRTDSFSVELAKNVKVLAIENPAMGGFYQPFQSQITAREYPFVQEIYMHDLQGYTGLAKGFIAWVASQPGQILMKKSGLVPAHDMGRTIELSEE